MSSHTVVQLHKNWWFLFIISVGHTAAPSMALGRAAWAVGRAGARGGQSDAIFTRLLSTSAVTAGSSQNFLSARRARPEGSVVPHPCCTRAQVPTGFGFQWQVSTLSTSGAHGNTPSVSRIPPGEMDSTRHSPFRNRTVEHTHLPLRPYHLSSLWQ